MVYSFGNLDGASYQKPNPGGVRRLLVLSRRDFAVIWPYKNDVVDGEVINPPVMRTADTVFAEYQCPDGTVEVSGGLAGDASYMNYKHNIGFSFAGFSKEITAELRKYQNAGCVFAVEFNDGKYGVLGSSDNPLYLKTDFKSGRKGSDKRGYDLKGEQDGFMWDIAPLKDECIPYLTSVREFAPEWEFVFH